MKTEFQKDREFLIDYVFHAVADAAERKLPETGDFPAYTVHMEDPEDGVTCVLTIQRSHQEDATHCISLGCLTPGTDRLYSNFVFWGSKAQILGWLREESRVGEAAEIYCRLRASCKES